MSFLTRILPTGKAMKSFLERLAARDELGRVGGRRCFRDLGMGETAAVSLGTKEKVSWHVIISIQTVLCQIKQNQWASLFCRVIATIEYKNI
jgi:hypothetical protein